MKKLITTMSYISAFAIIMAVLAWLVKGPLNYGLNHSGAGSIIVLMAVSICIVYYPIYNAFTIVFSGFARKISEKIKGL